MMRHATAFLCGALFSVGLAVSGMTQPAKIIDFLDVTGHWDPTLAFVMGGALLLFIPGYRLIRRRSHPLLTPDFDVPLRRAVTPSLVLGAAVFGIGWGLGGYCPGPAVTALPTLGHGAVGITVGMALGMVATRWVRRLLRPMDPIPAPDA